MLSSMYCDVPSDVHKGLDTDVFGGRITGEGLGMGPRCSFNYQPFWEYSVPVLDRIP